ncbi:MAG: hypothetical protein ABF968_05825 [Acetobacter sp.]|uniref:hypothetical protein n=1 Tax=Acetobacter sp. TaxID=440 RepID=UPI0039E9713C
MIMPGDFNRGRGAAEKTVDRPQTTITLKSSLDRAQALAALVSAASSAMLSGKSDPATECGIIDAAAEVAVAMKAERVDIIRTQRGVA